MRGTDRQRRWQRDNREVRHFARDGTGAAAIPEHHIGAVTQKDTLDRAASRDGRRGYWARQSPRLIHVRGGQKIGWFAMLDPFPQDRGWSEYGRSDRVRRRRKRAHHVGESGGQTSGGIDAQRLGRACTRGHHGRHARQYASDANRTSITITL
jgi:hypothetical protein